MRYCDCDRRVKNSTLTDRVYLKSSREAGFGRSAEGTKPDTLC